MYGDFMVVHQRSITKSRYELILVPRVSIIVSFITINVNNQHPILAYLVLEKTFVSKRETSSLCLSDVL